MARHKKDPETTTVVWHENLPPELEEFLKKQFDEAEEREKKRREKRAQTRKKKEESGTATDSPS